MRSLGGELCVLFEVKTTAQASSRSVYWSCRLCVLLLSSLGCDFSCSTLILELGIFIVHLIIIACQWWCLRRVHPFLLRCRALWQQQWVFPEGGSEGTPIKSPFQGRMRTAELSDCLHTDGMSQSFCLFVFILTLASPGVTVVFFRMSCP